MDAQNARMHNAAQQAPALNPRIARVIGGFTFTFKALEAQPVLPSAAVRLYRF